MGRIGLGYGSEWHLLRFLGRHRAHFDERVRGVLGDAKLEWLDFPFAGTTGDEEWKGLDFVPDPAVRSAWQAFWPQTGNVQNWDAVGKAERWGQEQWVLVEAKSHLAELHSDCGAKAATSLAQIRAAFAKTKAALGVPADADWEHGYYQFSNRVTTLQFLAEHGVEAHLLLVYFVGDAFPVDGFECPKSVAEWTTALAAEAAHVGLPADHPLSGRVHHLFLDVSGRDLRSTDAPSPCPQCLSLGAVPIVYGMPGPEAWERHERGEVELGGCMPQPERWHCRRCGRRWADRPDYSA